MTVTSTGIEISTSDPVYALDFLPSSSSLKLACCSYNLSLNNKLTVTSPSGQEAEIHHGYPATKLLWDPKGKSREGNQMLATTGENVKLWNYLDSEETGAPSQLKLIGALSNAKNPANAAPLTSFSWNATKKNYIVTSSIDTTCTVWDLETRTAVTQLIAHDKEVYDVSWLPASSDVFVSVGADGSLRVFDLRSLEHSTIVYESNSPLLRVEFNPQDPNYLSTFQKDKGEINLLDIRSPGTPVVTIDAHSGCIGGMKWRPSTPSTASSASHQIATSGDDCMLYVYDLNQSFKQLKEMPKSTAKSSSGHPLQFSRPDSQYTHSEFIHNIAWNRQADWIAVAGSRGIKLLHV